MNKDEFENKTLDENDFREVVAENNQVIDKTLYEKEIFNFFSLRHSVLFQLSSCRQV